MRFRLRISVGNTTEAMHCVCCSSPSGGIACQFVPLRMMLPSVLKLPRVLCNNSIKWGNISRLWKHPVPEHIFACSGTASIDSSHLNKYYYNDYRQMVTFQCLHVPSVLISWHSTGKKNLLAAPLTTGHAKQILPWLEGSRVACWHGGSVRVAGGVTLGPPSKPLAGGGTGREDGRWPSGEASSSTSLDDPCASLQN